MRKQLDFFPERILGKDRYEGAPFRTAPELCLVGSWDPVSQALRRHYRNDEMIFHPAGFHDDFFSPHFGPQREVHPEAKLILQQWLHALENRTKYPLVLHRINKADRNQYRYRLGTNSTRWGNVFTVTGKMSAMGFSTRRQPLFSVLRCDYISRNGNRLP